MVAPFLVDRRPDRLGSYVTIDGIDYPLVPGSEVLGAPLNPFSPASQAGTSSRITSQRHAVRVWDDFTQGIGYKDDNEEHGGIAYANLDLRSPAAVTLPQYATPLGTTSGFNSTTMMPVRTVYMQNANDGTYCFFSWANTATSCVIRTIRGTNRNIVNTVLATEVVTGVAQWQGNWYFLTNDTSSPFNSRLYKITNLSHLNGVITFSAVLTVAVKYQGLVAFDNKLITYDYNANTFVQLSSTPSWVAYIGGIDKQAFLEDVNQLFVWTDKSGSKDALYALTTARIMVYDDEGQQWEPFYEFARLWPAVNGYCHVNQRDNTLLFVPLHAPDLTPAQGGQVNDIILAFSPGTVDNWKVNKDRGLPTEITWTAGGGHIASVPATIVSGSHWTFAFMYCPNVGATSGIGSTVMARNAEGGWTIVFDPNVISGGGYAYSPIIGGGYGGGRMCVYTADGRYWDFQLADNTISHPYGAYDGGNLHTYFARSGRIYNGQRNVTKLASHLEMKFQEALVGTETIELQLNTWDGVNMTGFTTSGNLAASGVYLVAYVLPVARPYKYAEWKVTLKNAAAFQPPPIIESISLYYTYWQENHFAYSFSIDLSAETWATEYPTGQFHGHSRSWLQQQLLAMIDGETYHTFNYNRWDMRESITKVDILLSRREMADNGGGVYPCTARDLER